MQFFGIGYVEIANKHQIAGRPRALARKGMAGVFIVRAARSVAQVAYQQLCGVVKIALDGLRELGVDNPGLDLVVVYLQLVGKNFG